MVRIVAVPLPVPAAIEAILQANPGWGRGFQHGSFEFIKMESLDLYQLLVAAGAHPLGSGHRSMASQQGPAKADIQKLAQSHHVTVADFITETFGEEILE